MEHAKPISGKRERRGKSKAEDSRESGSTPRHNVSGKKKLEVSPWEN
jgi:hypothetical protein